MHKVSKYLSYSLLVMVCIGVFLCAYFHPLIRDDFYYIFDSNIGFIDEYINAYHVGNPRIGQLVTNIMMRSGWPKSVYAIILFNGFAMTLFLNVFRRIPQFSSPHDILKMMGIMGLFSFLIYVFGEMFFYTSFSSNYTLSNIFYLLFIYIITEYYIFKRSQNIPFVYKGLGLFFIGIYTGMCNEHVTPVIVALSGFYLLKFIFKYKKLPNFSILLYQISLGIGYLILFFAPANSNKYKTLGKEEEVFQLSTYFKNFHIILNHFRFFNLELILLFIASLGVAILLFRKKMLRLPNVYLLAFYIISAFLVVFIVAYAPIIGNRLLFFSNTNLFIVIMTVFLYLPIHKKYKKITYALGSILLIIMLGVGVYIYRDATRNEQKVLQAIAKEKVKTDEVMLNSGFNYFKEELGAFNRRFVLDKGEEYIDANSNEDTPQERLLKMYYNVKSISVKP